MERTESYKSHGFDNVITSESQMKQYPPPDLIFQEPPPPMSEEEMERKRNEQAQATSQGPVPNSSVYNSRNDVWCLYCCWSTPSPPVPGDSSCCNCDCCDDDCCCVGGCCDYCCTCEDCGDCGDCCTGCCEALAECNC